LEKESIINTFIQASVESAQQPKIIIETENRTWNILSQFHTLVSIPFGMGKSQLARRIPNSHYTSKFTLASMIGTITKDGEVIESALKNAANKVLTGDEAHRMSPSALDSLLNLLESGKDNRSLGYKAKTKIKIGTEKSGFMLSTTKTLNSIDIFARFSCILFAERIPSFMYGALLSRFASVLVKTSIDDAFLFIKGESILGQINQQTEYKKYKADQKIPKEEYLYFTNKYEDIIRKNKVQFKKDTHGYITRVAMNIIKLSAHFARVQNNGKITKEHIDTALDYTLPILKAIQAIQLTPMQLTILHMLTKGKMSQSEISKELQISKQAVNAHKKELEKSEYLDKTKNRFEFEDSDENNESCNNYMAPQEKDVKKIGDLIEFKL